MACKYSVLMSDSVGQNLYDELIGEKSLVEILIIEDNQFFAEIIKQVIELQGHNCKTANSMAQAFGLCKSGKYHLCVCDYNLPDTKGFTSIAKLKKLVNAPILLISGDSNPVDLSQLTNEKLINGFINKPFGKDLFIETINDLIDSEQ